MRCRFAVISAQGENCSEWTVKHQSINQSFFLRTLYHEDQIYRLMKLEFKKKLVSTANWKASVENYSTSWAHLEQKWQQIYTSLVRVGGSDFFWKLFCLWISSLYCACRQKGSAKLHIYSIFLRTPMIKPRVA
jgi:hypothetical protein